MDVVLTAIEPVAQSKAISVHSILRQSYVLENKSDYENLNPPFRYILPNQNRNFGRV